MHSRLHLRQIPISQVDSVPDSVALSPAACSMDQSHANQIYCLLWLARREMAT